eukprot:5905716-Prorocentrum_lima.AAC.1
MVPFDEGADCVPSSEYVLASCPCGSILSSIMLAIPTPMFSQVGAISVGRRDGRWIVRRGRLKAGASP